LHRVLACGRPDRQRSKFACATSSDSAPCRYPTFARLAGFDSDPPRACQIWILNHPADERVVVHRRRQVLGNQRSRKNLLCRVRVPVVRIPLSSSLPNRRSFENAGTPPNSVAPVSPAAVNAVSRRNNLRSTVRFQDCAFSFASIVPPSRVRAMFRRFGL
jgi:hypothetical protein